MPLDDMKQKPSEKQTGPQTREEDKPGLEDYKSEELRKTETKPKEPSDTKD
ncbi:MAG TPA: hypothetical protein VH621_00105 [Nitrososphaera sp.]